MPFDVRDFPAAPPEDRAASRRNRRLVASWLFGVAGMVLVMVVLGGVTRLTGSGLSIMEWAPLRRHATADERCGMAAAVPPLPADPAIRPGERGLRPRRLQADLLAGMDPPVVGPADRPGLPRPAGLVLGDRADRAPAASLAGAAVRAGRPAGPGRLDHGRVRLRPGQHRGVAVSAGHPSGAGAGAVCRPGLDRPDRVATIAAAPGPRAGCCACWRCSVRRWSR